MRKFLRRFLKKDRYTERFTINSRKAMIRSSEIAEMNNNAFVEPLHLLIGLTHEPTSLAAQWLESHGIIEEDLLGILEEAEFEKRLPKTKLQIGSEAGDIIQEAIYASMKMKLPQINTGHILMAMSQAHNSLTNQVLNQSHASSGMLPQEIIKQMKERYPELSI